MSPMSYLSEAEFDCRWEHDFGQLLQAWAVREQVSSVLKDASAAFAAQLTFPDGYAYMDACDRLASFLNTKIRLDHSEQKLVVQVLQVACAMHENALNNVTLSDPDRATHHLASMSLSRLCQSAMDFSLTHTDLWCDVFGLHCHAEAALYKAADVSRAADVRSSASPPSPLPPWPSPSPPPRTSLHDVSTTDASPIADSAKFKQHALATLNERPATTPLGRAHTMPNLGSDSRSRSPSPSSRSGRLAKPYARPSPSRGRGLQTVQEVDE